MIPGPAFCPHGRLSDGCEDCALLAGMERGYRPQPAHTTQPPAPEHAEHDLYCDQGEGRFVFIAAGDAIPAALAGLPRLPRTPPASPADDQPPAKRRQ